MDFIEHIRVGKECAETRFGTEEDLPSAVGGTRIILRISVAENSPAEGDELFMFFGL